MVNKYAVYCTEYEEFLHNGSDTKDNNTYLFPSLAACFEEMDDAKDEDADLEDKDFRIFKLTGHNKG